MKEKTPEPWSRIKEHFLAALELKPKARRSYLDAIDEETVRREVASLLEAHERSTDVLDSSGLGFHEARGEATSPDSQAQPQAGQIIGAWRLIEKIGRGGMGTVFLAERADGAFDQRVALKVLDKAAREDLIQRFVRERQILATIEHPNIARLLDGGTTDRGVPFLVMEYVEGEPLTTYCDRKSLSIEERLELFREICAAVQVAHKSLIIHRDLKPGNILVTEDGEPKLLDFGIAKSLDPGWKRETIEPTRLGGRPLTLLYASPEQVRGDALTTATDVYSLGIVLYELLTGSRPYGDERESWSETVRAICDRDPPKPSASALLEQSTEEGQTKGPPLAAEKLAQRLKGDLDAIVLKALRKEPQHRYESVERLSEDLRRHLEGFPILARQGTLLYRGSRFVRRHSLGVAAALLMALLVAGAAVKANFDAARIQREAEKANAVNQFLQRTLFSPDPYSREGKDVRMLDAVVAAAPDIEREFAAQPLVRAELHETVGVLFSNLGQWDQAEEHLEASQRLFREHLGERTPRLAHSSIEYARLRDQMGQDAEAEMLLRSALDTLRETESAESEETARGLLALGGALHDLGRLEEAEEVLRESLNIHRELFGPEHRSVASSLNNLALVLNELGDFEAARGHFSEALSIQEKLLGSQHVGIADTLLNLGATLEDLGEYDQAEEHYLRALALYREGLGETHPEVATALNQLGLVHLAQGEYSAAESELSKSLALLRESFGSNHPNIASTLNNLGTVASAQGDYERAEDLYREALRMCKQLLEPDHQMIAKVLTNLGVVSYNLGDLEVAADYFRQGLKAHRQVFQGDHPHIAANLINLGAIARDLGEYTEAEQRFQEALEMNRRIFGERHPRVATSLDFLATTLEDKGEIERAEPLLREALDMRRHLLGDGHPDVLMSLNNLAHYLVSQGRYNEAEPLYREALEIQAELDPDHPEAGVLLVNFANLLRDQGDPQEAMPHYERAFEILNKHLELDHYLIANARSNYGACLAQLGRDAEAEDHLVYAAGHLARTQGAESLLAVKAAKRLEEFRQSRNKP